MTVILLNRRAIHTSNHSHYFSDGWPLAATRSRRRKTPMAYSAMGGAHRRRANKVHQGSKLIEIGSYGDGAVRGTHLGAPQA
jgi:hypothetical protein